MRFPGIAYSFMRGTDVSGPTALILSRHFQQSSSDLTLEFLFSNLAKDRVLVLTNVSITTNPGATQATTEIRLQGISQGVENFEIASRQETPITDQNPNLLWQGEVYIQGGGPGTDTIRIISSYSAAVNANKMVLGVHGIIIPRGNLGGF